jgi:tRNA(Ile)-lysidine synthase
MAHERVRVRKALDVLDGLGVSREAVALTAARLGRARSALEVAQAGLMQVAVRIKANSYAEIDLECWVHGPAELQVRVIMTLASMFGGGQEISLSGAERVRDWTLAGQGRATTFAGCRFARRKREIVVGREAARIGCHGERLSGAMVWDNRYEIAVPAGLLPATVVPARDCKVWRGRATFPISSGKGCRSYVVKGVILRRLAPHTAARPVTNNLSSALFTHHCARTMRDET